MLSNHFKSLSLLCLLSIQMLNQSTAMAKSGGSMDGGGGDASEERVNEIRSDILKWISNGGARDLVLPEDISYSDYVSKMTTILEPQKVIVGFVEKDDEYNDELKVSVDGSAKTCRGFISKTDLRPHILCNISRFKNTSDSEQYKLIHHEYAGLKRLEKNLGAASDYQLSSQITGYLEKQTVLKLAIKSKKITATKLTAEDYEIFDKKEESSFGPIPLSYLKKKNNCVYYSNPRLCTTFSAEDVQKEIDMFTANLDKRMQTITQRLAIITKASETVKELAGHDTSLKSYRFYSDAAAHIANLPKKDKVISDMLQIFNQKNSPLLKDLSELKEFIIKYDQKIEQENDSEIALILKTGRDTEVMKKFGYLLTRYEFEHIIWKFFTNELNVIQAMNSNGDNRKFSLAPYVNIINSCASEELDLGNIAISSEAQKESTRDYDSNFLSIIEDHAIVKKVIDASPVITLKCKKVRKVLNTPEMKFDPETNTFTNEYQMVGGFSKTNSPFPSPASTNLHSIFRQYLN